MIKRIITCIVFLLCSAALAAQTSEKAWNFDADTPGGIPEGFTVVLGDWKTVADADVPSRPGVLAQLKILDQHSTSFWLAERTARTWTSRSR
jgi:hypothetical protein